MPALEFDDDATSWNVAVSASVSQRTRDGWRTVAVAGLDTVVSAERDDEPQGATTAAERRPTCLYRYLPPNTLYL